MEINVEPEKGWKTEDMFVPAGFHIDAEMTGEDEEPEGEAGEQPFSYPMGVGGVLMNGCYGTNYQPGDPCYEAYWETTICAVSLQKLNIVHDLLHANNYFLLQGHMSGLVTIMVGQNKKVVGHDITTIFS